MTGSILDYQAASVGFVVAFMLFYYRGSGVNAVVALLLNMLLMIAGLILFGATLTLPGIAGMILTIGMAVDSNVLIFERIREELRTGKTIPSAVEQGVRRRLDPAERSRAPRPALELRVEIRGPGARE